LIHFYKRFSRLDFVIMPPKNMARRGGARPSNRRAEPERFGDDGGNDYDVEDGEDGVDQSDAEKRQVRRKLRDMHDKLMQFKDKFTAGENSEEFAEILQEANQILNSVKGTQEAIEDAKMFKLLCQSVREMSEDTNTNEKKFHSDEYCAHLGRHMNTETSNKDLQVTRLQLVSLGERLSSKFRRTPTMTFVLGAIDTEPPESADRPAKQKKKTEYREKVATKTVIHEKSQANEQKTDRLVNSTRKILESAYRQNGKKPVSYFDFVIDPDSFGNTVENMFHVSFLVKQRVCRLSVDDESELPVLEPILTGKPGIEEEKSKNQAVISISYQDWEELKEALDISEATIKHDSDLASNFSHR